MGKGNGHGSRRRAPAARASEPQAARTSDPRKVSVYLPDAILHEIQGEAQRQERSLSWIVQKSWRMAREEIKKLAV